MSAQDKVVYFKDPQVVAVPPANAKPTPDDKFIYIGRCHHTKRDITMCYQTFGDHRNPCLLLICGLSSTCYSFSTEFCEHLVDIGFYVVRFDNRDYGLSTHMDGFPTLLAPRFLIPASLAFGEGEPPYRIEEMALDALNLLIALGLPEAHILGASMGGMIAQCMAIRQPERIRSLTIVFSHCGSPSVKQPSITQSFLLGFGKPKSPAIEDVIEFKMKMLRLNAGEFPLDEKLTTEYIRAVYNRLPDYKEGSNRQMWAIKRSERRDKALQKLRGIPTLIIHGLKDTLVPYENGIHLGELIKGSKVVLFPGMGHSLSKEIIPAIVEELQLLKRKAETTPRA